MYPHAPVSPPLSGLPNFYYHYREGMEEGLNFTPVSSMQEVQNYSVLRTLQAVERDLEDLKGQAKVVDYVHSIFNCYEAERRRVLESGDKSHWTLWERLAWCICGSGRLDEFEEVHAIYERVVNKIYTPDMRSKEEKEALECMNSTAESSAAIAFLFTRLNKRDRVELAWVFRLASKQVLERGQSNNHANAVAQWAAQLIKYTQLFSQQLEAYPPNVELRQRLVNMSTYTNRIPAYRFQECFGALLVNLFNVERISVMKANMQAVFQGLSANTCVMYLAYILNGPEEIKTMLKNNLDQGVLINTNVVLSWFPAEDWEAVFPLVLKLFLMTPIHGMVDLAGLRRCLRDLDVEGKKLLIKELMNNPVVVGNEVVTKIEMTSLFMRNEQFLQHYYNYQIQQLIVHQDNKEKQKAILKALSVEAPLNQPYHE